MGSSHEEVAVNQRQPVEPSVSKKYRVSWAPSLAGLTQGLGEKTPNFKVEVTDPEDPLGRKWFLSIYPSEHSRVETKLLFKGHCWDRGEYRVIQWGWVTLEASVPDKGEIQL